MKRGRVQWLRAVSSVGLLCAGGCGDMSMQPKQQTYSPLVGPAALPSAIVEYDRADPPPPRVSRALLERGRERYDIYCAPCHARSGDGGGMIVQRGFPPPESLHSERLRAASPQYIVDVITKGFGTMYAFDDRVQTADRWAIAAYIRALQRSQHATAADLAASGTRTPSEHSR